jgi:hypothetical protein
VQISVLLVELRGGFNPWLPLSMLIFNNVATDQKHLDMGLTMLKSDGMHTVVSYVVDTKADEF